MPKHRGLSLKKFVFAIPWNLFEQYFEQLKPGAKPNAWAFLNPDVLEEFLNDPENAEASPVILEDFQRINDLGGMQAGLLIRAYDRYQLPFDQEAAPQASAMWLFLNARESF